MKTTRISVCDYNCIHTNIFKDLHMFREAVSSLVRMRNGSPLRKGQSVLSRLPREGEGREIALGGRGSRGSRRDSEPRRMALNLKLLHHGMKPERSLFKLLTFTFLKHGSKALRVVFLTRGIRLIKSQGLCNN